MNNVLLGNVAVVTNTGDVPTGPPNPDGTYNITLPADTAGGDVVAKDTDAPVDETGLNPDGDYTDDKQGDDNGGMKKLLPFVIAGGVLLFILMRKK